jgi:hypothetical protein
MSEKVFLGSGSKKVRGARHRDLTRMRSMELCNALPRTGFAYPRFANQLDRAICRNKVRPTLLLPSNTSLKHIDRQLKGLRRRRAFDVYG